LAAAVWRLGQESAHLQQSGTSELGGAGSAITKAPAQVSVFPADPVWGPKTGAKVTVIEFSDFTCPYCAQAAPLLKQAVTSGQGQVSLVWKDFPLSSHPQARSAAEAAQCAGLQNKFWQYHDGLFASQADLNETAYYDLARELSLNMDGFTKCFTEHQASPLINRNLEEAQTAGVDGTPFLIVNGRIYNGAITTQDLNQLIEQARK